MTACHICGHAEPALVDFTTTAVSSDSSRVFPPVRYLQCPQCLTLQTAVTDEWRKNCAAIYAGYQDGPVTAPLWKRIEAMIDLLQDLPLEGRLFELGCGPGHFLKQFGACYPHWRLSAMEYSTKWREQVLAIPAVETFLEVGAKYPNELDLFVMAGLLEHLPDPIAHLEVAARSLAINGRLLVVVPNYRQNAADLVIYDHCTHFDPASFAAIAQHAGLTIERMDVGREITALLAPEPDAFAILRNTVKAAWDANPDGIMGSTIAARWLLAELGGSPTFFVDEDPARIGDKLAGLSILHPDRVPAGAKVFIPMARPVADAIIARWKHLPIEWKTA